MLDAEEIYRRCHNNYGMKQDEIETLVLKGTDYTGTDEEKLNAFYSDLLRMNTLTADDSFGSKVKDDTRKLDDNDQKRLDEIRKRNKKKAAAKQSLDEEAYEAAGSHLPAEERMSFKDMMQSLKNFNLEDDEDETDGD